MANADTYKASHNDYPISELLSHFRSTRAKFIHRLETIDERHLEKQALHPRLQQMITITDLLFFIAEHDVHHLTQIARLIKYPYQKY